MRRPIALLISYALILVTAALVTGTALTVTTASADPLPALAVSATGPDTILVGSPAEFTFQAKNDSSQPQYNLTFRTVLPVGVSYRAGSTGPAGVGEPRVVTDPVSGQQTLLWIDTFDLQPGSTSSITFAVDAAAAEFPVGRSFSLQADSYVSAKARVVPKFTDDGTLQTQPTPQPAVRTATSTAVTTTITAISVTKSEPSPESKLLRGVHTRGTVYTVQVTNNGVHPTTGVTVTDYLPANLEFLGCAGQSDNSTAAEYPGSGPIMVTVPTSNCPTPESVSTVQDPEGYAPGVYTKLVWTIDTLESGATYPITYAAGVPLFENVLFPNPVPTGLSQTANLDNNTGPSTRQVGAAAPAVNHVHVAGSYQGPTATDPTGPALVTAETSHTVTVHDLRILKSVEESVFASGEIATFKLKIDSSEYTDNSGITITDTLPNGLCPLDDLQNYVAGQPEACDPVSADLGPTLAYQDVTHKSDGTFTVVFAPLTSVPANGSQTVVYPTRMRADYTGGSRLGQPTVAGDLFANTAEQAGTSAPITGSPETGPQPVTDASSVSLSTTVETLTKLVGARSTPMTCTAADYLHLATPRPVFVKGDRVCFQLIVDFSSSVDTRNAVLTDFLPEHLRYEDGSWTVAPGSTVPSDQVTFASSSGSGSGEDEDEDEDQLVWELGEELTEGVRNVAKGAKLVLQFSAIVIGPAASYTQDKSGNLLKLRSENSEGQGRSLREEVAFEISPAPVAIDKGVSSVNGVPNPGGGDHVQVKEKDQVTFHVDVKNISGTDATGPEVEVSALNVWDVLPLGIGCGDISAISHNGQCADPANTPLQFVGNDLFSAVWWNATGVTLEADKTLSLTYVLTVQEGSSVATRLVNTASVRSYLAQKNHDLTSTQQYYPGDNVDTSLDPLLLDPMPVTDPSDIYLPAVVLTKGVTSAVNETGNRGGEAVPAASTDGAVGEQVIFTVIVQLPAHTSVYNATLIDPLPAGLTADSRMAQFSPNAGASYQGLPTGVSLTAGQNRIDFGEFYDNTTDSDQWFRLTVYSRVAADATGTLINTGTFDSGPGLDPNQDPAAQSASANVVVVNPAPKLTKTNNSGGPVAGGNIVTFTLTASNATGSVLHNAWVVDCLPAGLIFSAYGSPTRGWTDPVAPGAGPGGNNVSCPSGTTQLAWNVGDLAAGVSGSLSYTATVDPSATGSLTYTNQAYLTGDSVGGPRSNPTQQPTGAQRYPASAQSSVAVAGAALVKSVTPIRPTVGETVTYTLTATVPASVNFYNVAVIDTLPAGIDASTVALVPGSITCTNADTSNCGLTSPTALARSGQVFGWLFGDVVSALQTRTATLQYTATVADVTGVVSGSILTNSAHIAWDAATGAPPTSADATFHSQSSDDTASVVIREPSLSITKLASNPTPQPGDAITYTLSVANASGTSMSDAYNLSVTDVVPVGVVVNPASISPAGTITGNNATTGGGTITWTITAPLTPGASVNGATGLSYSATLAPSVNLGVAALVNTATVSGYDSLSSGGRHYSGPSTTATVTPTFPHLTTSKATPGGTTAYLNQPFSWRVTILNAAGAGKAYAVGATDTLPANWTYDANSATVSVNGGASTSLEPGITTAGATQTLTWPAPLAAELPAGQTVVITYTATPGANAVTTPGVGLDVDHLNTATATGTDATGATGNAAGSYSATAATAVAHLASADVSLTKAMGVGPFAGQDGTWTLTVANAGPDAAAGPFTVTDGTAPPTGIVITGVAGPGWTCTLASVSCHRTAPGDTLAAAAGFPAITVTYSVAANVAAGTAYSNTADVTARTYDPTPTNNTSTAAVTVETTADLGVTKVLSGSMTAGQDATYTIGVHNYGPSDSQGPIKVTDPLPAGTTFVSASGGLAWSCDAAPLRVLTCTRSTALANGADTQDIVVVLAIPAGQTTPVTNVATVVATTGQGTNTHPDTASAVITPGARADLTILKTLTTELVAGDTATYHLAVGNNGPSAAQHPVITDTLPATLTYHSHIGPDWSCGAVAQLVTCTYTANAGVLPADGTAALDLLVTVGQLRGPVSNTATIGSDTPDPAPANNTSTADSSITRSADLSILKSHTGAAVAGQSLAYTLQVHNAGPSHESGNVTVTDILPAGLTYQSAAGTGWLCAYEAQDRTVTCVGATDLATGSDAAPITVTVAINPDAGPATLVNTATVAGTADSPDPTPANNTATDSTVVTVLTDVTLVKTLTTATPVVAGTDATFTLQASNAGPSNATTVSVTDTLPTYLTYVSASGPGWTCGNTGQVVSCTRATLPAAPPGAAVGVITVVATVDPSTPFEPVGSTTTLVNRAAITTGSPGTTHNPDPVDVPVIAQADLTLNKTVASATTVAGTDVTWTLAVHNAGPSDAAGPITVTDTLPGFQSVVSASGEDWTCTPGVAPSPPSTGAHQSLVCILDGPLAVGEDAPEITVQANVDVAAPVGDQTNTATVDSPTLDPTPANNTDTATTTISRVAELSIVKSHTGNGAVGEELSFQIAVHNAGPSQADQLVVTDLLPAGLTYVSGTGTDWTCEEQDGEVTCSLAGVLDPDGDAAPITLVTTVAANAYPSVVNTAVLGSSSPDLPDTVEGPDLVTVDPLAQLAITKTHQGEFTVGKHGTYEIVVTNTGPTPTPGPVLVEDTLPAGLSFVSVAGDGWSCSESISCTWPGAMAVDETATITVVVDVLAAAYPQVVNTATASAPGSTPVTDTDTAPVTPVIALSLLKRHTAYQQNVATYSLTVRNDGPSATVSPTTVVDALPAGLSYLAATGAGWTCTSIENTVQCEHTGSIRAGASATLTLRASVSAAAGSQIHNTAGVTGGGIDPSAVSQSNVASFTVTASGELATTGAAVTSWLRLALLLTLAGALLLLLTRRHRS